MKVNSRNKRRHFLNFLRQYRNDPTLGIRPPETNDVLEDILVWQQAQIVRAKKRRAFQRSRLDNGVSRNDAAYLGCFARLRRGRVFYHIHSRFRRHGTRHYRLILENGRGTFKVRESDVAEIRVNPESTGRQVAQVTRTFKVRAPRSQKTGERLAFSTARHIDTCPCRECRKKWAPGRTFQGMELK